MTTDLFTVQKYDILEFTANLIDWRKISYVPVEDDDHHLVGLVTMRMLFRAYSNKINHEESLQQTVGEIMIKNPITIHPEASIIEAMDIIDEQKIGCLPVVKNDRLVGIITEQNFITLSARLLRMLHSNDQKE
jgi:CBS domain-containing protein